MKFKFKNLGPIYQGEIELSKLTVLCGKNNTGKTYITNMLYSFFQNWSRLIDWEMPGKERNELLQKGVASLDLQENIVQKLDCKQMMQNLSENLSDFFACSPELFADVSFEFELENDDAWIRENFSSQSRVNSIEDFLTIKKAKGSTIAEIAYLHEYEAKMPLFILEDFVKNNLLKVCLGKTFPDVFIASAERTGASIFRSELNFNKNQLVGLLAEMERNGNKKINPFEIVRSFKRTYAESVEHNVDFISYKIESMVKKGQTDFIKNNAFLITKFQEIAGGTYKYHKDTGIYFQPNSAKGIKLGLGEASSAVRSLMIIWFWLNYEARPNSLLMIDEPELNLHPENQRKFAKFIAALVNAGIKVFMTTHSDYIIRELNTLVMLNSDAPHIEQVKKYFKYDEMDRINPTEMAVYNTVEELFKIDGNSRRKKLGSIEKWDVVEHLGIKIKSFDDQILEMNKIQDALRFGI